MHRKRHLHRKFADYYSRSFGFDRITARNLAKQLLWDRLGVLHQGVVYYEYIWCLQGFHYNYYKRVQGTSRVIKIDCQRVSTAGFPSIK